MKKILLVATVQSHICQFHRALVKMLRAADEKVEIHVAARDNLAEKNGLKLDFADKVFDVPFERSPFSAKNIGAYRVLKKIIDDGNYDIVHCNTPVGGILARMASKKCRRHGTKVFYTAHGFHFYNGAPKKNWMIYYPIEKYFSHYTDVLITINEEDYALAKSRFKCRVEHIHGVGVDNERFFQGDRKTVSELRKKLDTGDSAVLCVGELLPNKNQAMAIKAMSEVVKAVPDAKLFIAGNGPEQEELSGLINRLGLQNNVKLIGYITDLENWQKACAVSVSCSKREGLGLNLIEGMMSGNPAVAVKNRGHNELITDGENGFLVEQGDHLAMANRLIELLLDKEKYNSCSEKSMVIASGYSFDIVKKELKDIYYGKTK